MFESPPSGISEVCYLLFSTHYYAGTLGLEVVEDR